MLYDKTHPPTDLCYTCFLLPSEQVLAEELADPLKVWVYKSCTGHKWKLESVLVEREYLQLAIHISSTTTIKKVIHKIRVSTSKNINSAHGVPRVSKDFWAPGYLAIQGIRSNPDKLIEQYLRLVRR